MVLTAEERQRINAQADEEALAKSKGNPSMYAVEKQRAIARLTQLLRDHPEPKNAIITTQTQTNTDGSYTRKTTDVVKQSDGQIEVGHQDIRTETSGNMPPPAIVTPTTRKSMPVIPNVNPAKGAQNLLNKSVELLKRQSGDPTAVDEGGGWQVTPVERKIKYEKELDKLKPSTEEVNAAMKAMNITTAIPDLSTTQIAALADAIRVSRESNKFQANITARAAEKARKASVAELSRQIDEGLQQAIAREKRNRAGGYAHGYVCGSQVGVFIGDQWVDDIAAIEFTKTVNKLPVYGYSSDTFNAVAKGTIIVNGNFSIVYTNSGYLPALLKHYLETEGEQRSSPFEGKSQIERAKEIFWRQDTNISNNQDQDPLRFGYMSGFVGEIKRGFDIKVAYGVYDIFQSHIYENRDKSVDFNDSVPVDIIKNVHLTSRTVIVSPTGEPVGETYTFLAADVYPLHIADHSVLPTSDSMPPARPSILGQMWGQVKGVGSAIMKDWRESNP